MTFRDGDWLLFGSETHGLDAELLNGHPGRLVRIPQTAQERCLNLSSAVAVGLYEALRRVTPPPSDRCGGSPTASPRL